MKILEPFSIALLSVLVHAFFKTNSVENSAPVCEIAPLSGWLISKSLVLGQNVIFDPLFQQQVFSKSRSDR